MRAIVVSAFGGCGALAESERATPVAGPNEVAIDVVFAGVGFIDVLVRSGAFDFVRPPFVPGIEVSGIVRAVGSEVDRLAVGQRVAALLTDFTEGGMGGYAEVVCAKAALTIPLGPSDDLATAAATVVNGSTAFLATQGQSHGAAIAISGASGGLGRNLIVAALHGDAARVVAISGNKPRTAELIRLGATEVVSPTDFLIRDDQFDAAYDTVGGGVRTELVRRSEMAAGSPCLATHPETTPKSAATTSG